ncbi:uncharacterized protein CANTADRAFT_7931 [Suhomyces tanzawaensis NRRL Y-17324]|uniref:Alcohol acetyltransferase n=1 Tax=Suhomyces tanzawaensis NRRL Y-17324 TaxID=984487 RepID=A0A1E4SD77_9ASCO|nr:uncharacterized protein CANTADRAFT_7931 [Suhomyces tanzawaensis NRRL Y-17324]ODV77469.1 hypothetical protein CANTADRAFT_7931 [Suhomyces tanzawaensis NRRL Y-17324]
MTQLSRLPGSVERYFLYKNLQSTYTNFNVSARYNRGVTPSQLANALQRLVQKEVWLTYSFFRDEDFSDTEDDDGWRLSIVDLIKFEDVVSFVKIEAFDETVLNDILKLTCPYNHRNLPLWRLIVFELPSGEQYLTFYFDHALYDGRSGVYFQEALCDELSSLKKADPIEILFEHGNSSTTVKAPMPPLEHYKELNPTILDLIQMVLVIKSPPIVRNVFNVFRNWWNLMVPDTYKNPQFTFGKPIPGPETRVAIIKLSPAEISQALSYCKSNSLTLTPLLHATYLQCLEEVVFSKIDSSTKFSTLTCIAIDVRRCLPPSKSFQVGMLSNVDIVELPPVLGRTNMFVRYLQSRLSKQASSNFMSIGRASFYGYFRLRKLREISRTPSRATNVLSNLGRIKETEQDYKIVDVVFSQTVGIKTNTTLCVVSSKEGGLNAVLSYVPNFDDYYNGEERVMDVFVREYKRRILAIIGGSENL